MFYDQEDISSYLCCPVCRQPFDAEQRVPLLLHCCNNTVCAACLAAQQHARQRPQEQRPVGEPHQKNSNLDTAQEHEHEPESEKENQQHDRIDAKQISEPDRVSSISDNSNSMHEMGCSQCGKSPSSLSSSSSSSSSSSPASALHVVNKAMLRLVQLRPIEMPRSALAQALKHSLSRLAADTNDVDDTNEHSQQKVQLHCARIRHVVQQSSDETLQQVCAFRDYFLGQIDAYERTCVEQIVRVKDALPLVVDERSYNDAWTTTPTPTPTPTVSTTVKTSLKGEFSECVAQMREFVDTWQRYLSRVLIDEDVVSEAYETSKERARLLDERKSTLDALIFNGQLLSFRRNELPLEYTLLGQLAYEPMLVRSRHMFQFGGTRILADEQLLAAMNRLLISEKRHLFAGTNATTTTTTTTTSSSSSSTVSMQLVYRASAHGFGADEFHERCDNRTNTLTLVRTETGRVFGGFTRATWNHTGKSKRDECAFLFRLVGADGHLEPAVVDCSEPDHAIYCHSAWCVVFGDFNYDLVIVNNANSPAACNYSNLGNCYRSARVDPADSKTFLAGAYFFTVNEIETFHFNS